MTEDLKPLPVAGYTAQSPDRVALVNEFKQDEERLLRKVEDLMRVVARQRPAYRAPTNPDEPIISSFRGPPPAYDQRWLDTAHKHFQEGFMALNRAVLQPQRIKLPEDGE